MCGKNMPIPRGRKYVVSKNNQCNNKQQGEICNFFVTKKQQQGDLSEATVAWNEALTIKAMLITFEDI